MKSLALLLYSDSGHVGAEAKSLRDAEAVRLQLMNALSAFRARVDALERRRPSRPELPPLAPRKSLRVLVVEDNRDSAETLARLLELSGYGVSVAYTAIEGFETAKRERPDVILCDIGLPDSNGFALAEALRADPLTSGARLIAVTAYGKPGDLERSRQAGFAAAPRQAGEPRHAPADARRDGERSVTPLSGRARLRRRNRRDRSPSACPDQAETKHTAPACLPPCAS